jgi:Protein of unknown function (DUF3052)
MAGYSTTPLPKKLGIREGALVVLVSPPPRFAELLGPLPTDARVSTTLPKKERFDVAIVFSTKKKDLETRLKSAVKSLSESGAIWIAWPKKSSGVVTEVDEFFVRAAGLATGLVDNKVCAIDDTWSGLRFVVRVGDRQGHPKKRAT